MLYRHGNESAPLFRGNGGRRIGDSGGRASACDPTRALATAPRMGAPHGFDVVRTSRSPTPSDQLGADPAAARTQSASRRRCRGAERTASGRRRHDRASAQGAHHHFDRDHRPLCRRPRTGRSTPEGERPQRRCRIRTGRRGRSRDHPQPTTTHPALPLGRPASGLGLRTPRPSMAGGAQRQPDRPGRTRRAGPRPAHPRVPASNPA